MNIDEKGTRYNKGKLRWSLVDFKSLEDMVKVLEFGASKYEDFNWTKGLKTTEICESLLRHLFAYLDGEDVDKESNCSHVGHILCNAMFLNYMTKNKPDFDTRRVKTKIINRTDKYWESTNRTDCLRAVEKEKEQ